MTHNGTPRKSKELQDALKHLANVIVAFAEQNPVPSDYQAVNAASLWLQKRSKKWRDACGGGNAA